jgi:hypothetical protein
VRLNTTLRCINLRHNYLGEGGGRALAESLRLNTTLTTLPLGSNGLGEGGGRALAESLRLNTTLRLLYLDGNSQGEGGGRALAETVRLNATLDVSTFTRMAWEGNHRLHFVAWGDRKEKIERLFPRIWLYLKHTTWLEEGLLRVEGLSMEEEEEEEEEEEAEAET